MKFLKYMVIMSIALATSLTNVQADNAKSKTEEKGTKSESISAEDDKIFGPLIKEVCEKNTPAEEAEVLKKVIDEDKIQGMLHIKKASKAKSDAAIDAAIKFFARCLTMDSIKGKLENVKLRMVESGGEKKLHILDSKDGSEICTLSISAGNKIYNVSALGLDAIRFFINEALPAEKKKILAAKEKKDRPDAICDAYIEYSKSKNADTLTIDNKTKKNNNKTSKK